LAAIADDRDLLVADQTQVGIGIIIYAHLILPWSSQP